jgi:hypothetical protein
MTPIDLISSSGCWVRVAIWGMALFWAGWYLAQP